MQHQPKPRAPGAGRKPGPTMPCGWRCGAQLTAREMRTHFSDCPKKPTPEKSKIQMENQVSN